MYLAYLDVDDIGTVRQEVGKEVAEHLLLLLGGLPHGEGDDVPGVHHATLLVYTYRAHSGRAISKIHFLNYLRQHTHFQYSRIVSLKGTVSRDFFPQFFVNQLILDHWRYSRAVSIFSLFHRVIGP